MAKNKSKSSASKSNVKTVAAKNTATTSSTSKSGNTGIEATSAARKPETGTSTASKTGTKIAESNNGEQSSTTLTLAAGSTEAQREQVAREAMSKMSGENKMVTITGNGTAQADSTVENLGPNSPLAGTSGQTAAAARIAGMNPGDQDPSVAPPSAPVDQTPVPPPPQTPSDLGITSKKKEPQEPAPVVKKLVTRELNLRAGVDDPNVVGLIQVGAYVDIVGEATSTVTGSKWYKVDVAPLSMRGYLGKEKKLTGYVHSAFVQ